MQGARRARIAAWLGVAGLLASPPAQQVAGAASLHRPHRRRSSSHAPSATCAGADLTPGPSDMTAVARATLCLVNRERSAHRLRPLTESGALDRAARAYSLAMVRHGYFSDSAPGGGTLGQRVARSGYARSTRRPHTMRLVSVAENLATASGRLASPAAIVSMWMRSPSHRANLLGSSYRGSGIGVALGVPGSAGESGATYTQYFGSLR
ncbi:MAG: CAP domain-containing protein [Acidobacteriota bacterium]|nr:CAP domain-containing protein [Acidobacteriota bacterium]